MDKPHPGLTTDWVLGQFSTKRGQAEKKYREFVDSGIGGERIWEKVKGQSILGKDEFVEGLIKYLKRYEEIKEIPKSQRYIGRLALNDLFNIEAGTDKRRRDMIIREAVTKHGYSQKEVADYLGIHYSTVSIIIKKGK